MNEKMKLKLSGYEPVLSIVITKKENKMMLSIKDNGIGIPQKYMDKIFQPFFTTKPAGEGTGLGLSLSYDMIKAHQAELKVDSKEGEYATFTIVLNS